MYYYNGAQRYKDFLQVGRLYRDLILLGLALCLPSTSVSLVFMVLYIDIKIFLLASFSLPFSLVGLALDPVSQPLSFSAMMPLVGDHVTCKMSSKRPI